MRTKKIPEYPTIRIQLRESMAGEEEPERVRLLTVDSFVDDEWFETTASFTAEDYEKVTKEELTELINDRVNACLKMVAKKINKI